MIANLQIHLFWGRGAKMEIMKNGLEQEIIGGILLSSRKFHGNLVSKNISLVVNWLKCFCLDPYN